MKLPRSILTAFLLVLFMGALFVRLHGFSESARSYFKGESGVRYRYAYMIGQKGRLPEIDKKASWPEGFVPSRVEATGSEFVTGYLYKPVGYFSDMNERQFVHLLDALFFAVLSIIMFAVSYAVWGCQAGALLSSCLMAFSAPLVGAVGGGTYNLPIAAIIVALHILFLGRYAKRPSAWNAFPASLCALALAAVWGKMLLYLAPCMLWAALAPVFDRRSRLILLAQHLVMLALAAFLFPHVAATGVLLSFPAALLYASFVFVLIGKRRGPVLQRALLVLAGAGVLSVMLSLFRPQEFAGASPWSYVLHRARFLFGKPADPALLPMNVRFLWTLGHTYPGKYELLSMFLPILFLVPPLVDGLRSIRSRGAPVVLPVLAALAPIAAFLLDRSAIVFATMGIAVLMAPSLYAFSKNVGKRIVFLVVGFLLLATQAFQPHGAADLAFQAGRRLHVTPDRTAAFTWISIGNADADLVQFLATHTSTTDPFLSTPEIAPFILTFAGRTTTLVPGVDTKKMMAKTQKLMGSLYADEETLYETCRETGITRVLYSIDMTLDGSPYSPRYLAGAPEPRSNCAAYRMQFFPEELTHFELIFENDNYRVFTVAEHAGPVFLSDHPLVYQHEILGLNHDTLASFYDRIVRIMSLYALATDAEKRAAWDTALDLHRRCLAEAPRFTLAWLGTGRSLIAEEKWDLAKAAYQSVIQYAPDNQEALYGAAFAMYHLGELETARRYLNLLLTTPGNSDVAKRARGLRNAIFEKLKGAE
jgi:hypothetical protein